VSIDTTPPSQPASAAEPASAIGPPSAAETVRLTEWTACGGCAAKWGASTLAGLLAGLQPGPNAALLVGLAPFDDAAVYQVADDLALVSTTDFFPPLVDDPADFGAIAAANACSDVFAMGGRVVLALNISAFPERMPPEVIAAVLAAAAETVTEAGGVVAGGHTIRSEEPIFGLAVQGLVHPDHVFTKGGAVPGDLLVLSKPLGTGILLAGGEEAEKRTAIAGMRQLNRAAATTLGELEDAIHAVTDVTGFGLLGHAWEVADRSGTRLVLDAGLLPLYPGAREAAARGVRTGGDARNREHLAGVVTSTADDDVTALAYDPQTSGGLLAAIAPSGAGHAEAAGFTIVGTVEPGPAGVALA
jgi:selenide, water dikinase